MAAPKGNSYYLLRCKVGRDRIFNEPKELLKRGLEYFRICEENPVIAGEMNKTKDYFGDMHDKPLIRPYTFEGLTRYLNTVPSWFNEFENRLKNKKVSELTATDKAFLNVLETLRHTIREQKYAGGMTGIFNPLLTARDLGLTESAVNVTNNQSADITVTPVTIQVVSCEYALGEDATEPGPDDTDEPGEDFEL